MLSHSIIQGAPEKVLERCKFVRLSDGSTTELTSALRSKIEATLFDYSGGRFTYRCLGLATVDKPASYDEITAGLTKGTPFVTFEVGSSPCSLPQCAYHRSHIIFRF